MENRKKKMDRKPMESAIRMVGIYLIFGMMWVFFSNSLIRMLIQDIDTYTYFVTYKGWLFIGITACIFFALIYRQLVFQEGLLNDLQSQNQQLMHVTDELKDKVVEIEKVKEELIINNTIINRVYKGANIPMVDWNLDGTIISVNDCFADIIGKNTDAFKGLSWCDFQFQECTGFEYRKKQIDEHGELRGFLTRVGDRYIIWNDKYYEIEGQPPFIFSLGTEVTEERKQQDQIHRMIYHDHLTGLGNRNAFERDVKEILLEYDQYALLYFDIDDFKEFNDLFGRVTGDQLLIYIGQLLKKHYGDQHVYRWSGDEYIVLCLERSCDELQERLQKVHAACHEKTTINGREVFFSVSTGVVRYPEDATNVDDVLRNADLAIRRAKQGGKSRFKRFEPSMLEEMETNNHIRSQLDQAIEKDELILNFQPIYEMQSQQIVGVETLLRWSPEEYELSTGMMIALAEETDQIIRIDHWVIDKTFRIFSEYPEVFSDILISVNVSTKTLRSFGFIGYLKQCVAKYGIDPNKITLEITEHSIIDDTSDSLEKMKMLKDIGFQISMDDFGTKYSSLNYLATYPFDCLKIDKSYVDEVDVDPITEKIVSSIVKLAHDLGLKTIAEGIETIEQETLMNDLGCKYAQGYLFARPMPLEALVELMEEQHGLQ
jgi:diguanylate cyclase (GGDEF)-like protein